MKKLVLLTALLSILSLPLARADEIYTFVIKKQEEKAKSRWSLSEWLDTRDRMRMMDLWLALHSPSPYEFLIGGNYAMGQIAPGSHYAKMGFSAAAYASIFGLGFEKDQTPEEQRWEAQFLLRVFGFHAQATNITLMGGLRGQTDSSGTFRNPMAGVAMTLYIGKFFGLDGSYRRYFAAIPELSGSVTSASRLQGGAFIDFRALQLYGRSFAETQPARKLTGVDVGARFYF